MLLLRLLGFDPRPRRRVAHATRACLAAIALVLAGAAAAAAANAPSAAPRAEPPNAFVFTNITTPALADTVNVGDKKGCAWIDWDGDGDLDLCADGDGAQAIALLRNDGNGVFTNVTSGQLLFGASGSGETWGDYDNDGRPDLFLSVEEAPAHLFHNEGNGVFTDVTSGPLLVPAHGHSCSWADIDRDGDLDLYVAHLHQAGNMYRNDGGGVFTDITTAADSIDSGDGVVFGDFDGDGDDDLYIVRFSGQPNRLLRNDGNGVFTDVTTPAVAIASNGHSGAAGDFDNDGLLDIYVADANDVNHLLRNVGGMHFVDVTPAPLRLGAHSVSPCWGDFDNDGYLDLFVTTTEFGQSHMFKNNGDGTFTDVTTGPLVGSGTAAGVAAGDFDGDGDLDLYYTSYNSHYPNALLRNELGAGNHWVDVDLVATASNRSAIGAQLTLIGAGGPRQFREVQGETGFRSQSALRQHFGLGAATSVVSLHVRWPSGFEQDTSLAAVDRIVTVVEHPPLASVPTGPVTRVALAAPAPNPLSRDTRLRFALPAPATAALAILDCQGRNVRTLAHGAFAPGDHALAWDGRDASGRRVGAGVYVALLETGGVRLSRRLVVVP